MHPGGVRSAMDLFDFEKSANLKHPIIHARLVVQRSNINTDKKGKYKTQTREHSCEQSSLSRLEVKILWCKCEL